MLYDIFTKEVETAEKIIKLIDRAYLVDDTESDSCNIYQFLEINRDQMRIIYKVGLCNDCEIRDRETGDFIWPNENGFKLEQVLDIL